MREKFSTSCLMEWWRHWIVSQNARMWPSFAQQALLTRTAAIPPGIQKAPLSTFEEYVRLAETSQYSWNKFRYFNEYAENRLRERREAQQGLFPREYLNIFNMTAFRHDEHKAGSYCLHYELPGVIDWWNHLLYTNLLDIAKREGS